MDEETIESLRRAARDWKICAVGNLCDKIPRDKWGDPKGCNK